MSAPVLKIGSIFGANKPSKPQSQPNSGEKGIFGAQSSIFGASARRISPQNQRGQGRGNPTPLSERRANNTPDRGQQNRRGQEPNRPMGKNARQGNQSQGLKRQANQKQGNQRQGNIRQTHTSTDMQIADQKFETWNQDPKKISFPNTKGTRLMSSAMSSLTRQQESTNSFQGFFSNKRDGSKSDSSQPTPERQPRERRQRDFNSDFKPRQKRP